MVDRVLVDASALQSAVESMAHEIVDELGTDFDMVGVASGGVAVAQLLLSVLRESHECEPRFGVIDITLYRDDLYTGLECPALGVTDIPFQIDSRPIVLIDDVIFTGRTIRAALQELGDLGRPKMVRLAVLLDRGHRELPIQPDYCGVKIQTRRTDRIDVEMDGVQKATVILRPISTREES